MTALIHRNAKLDIMLRRVRPSIQEVESPAWFRSGAPALVLRLSRALGVAPLVFANDRVRVSRALSIYGKILFTLINGYAIIFMVLSFMRQLPTPKQKSEHHGKTTEFVKNLRSVLSLIINFTAAFLTSARMKSWIKIVKRVEMVKTKLGEHSYQDKTKERELRALVSSIVTVTILYSVDFTLRAPFDEPKPVIILFLFLFVTQVLSGMVSMLIKLQMILTCRYISSLFPDYNRHLLLLLKAVDQSQTDADSALSTLRDLNAIYTEMCDLVDTMNYRHNGITMLLIVGHTAMHLIINPYNAFNKLLNALMPVTSFVFEILWIVYYFFYVCFIAEPGHRVIEETIQIRSTVSEIMGKTSYYDQEFLGELNKFFNKLIMIRPVFAPLGVFVVSRRLLVSILGLAVTYTVIIVQFRSSEI